MVNFTDLEYGDINDMYGLANGNIEHARRLYQERFPNRITPDRRTFYNIEDNAKLELIKPTII